MIYLITLQILWCNRQLNVFREHELITLCVETKDDYDYDWDFDCEDDSYCDYNHYCVYERECDGDHAHKYDYDYHCVKHSKTQNTPV